MNSFCLLSDYHSSGRGLHGSEDAAWIQAPTDSSCRWKQGYRPMISTAGIDICGKKLSLTSPWKKKKKRKRFFPWEKGLFGPILWFCCHFDRLIVSEVCFLCWIGVHNYTPLLSHFGSKKSATSLRRGKQTEKMHIKTKEFLLNLGFLMFKSPKGKLITKQKRSFWGGFLFLDGHFSELLHRTFLPRV